jgi:hypothetical protein
VKGGTSPYTFLWTPGGKTTATATGLAAGTYTVTVEGHNGCTGSPVIVAITQGFKQDSISLLLNIGCNGGNSGEVSVGTKGGVLPYTYSWSNGNTTYTESGLSAGTYTITTKDNNGCTSIVTASVTQPAAALEATVASSSDPVCHSGKGSGSITVTGGTTPYKYLWSPAVTTNASCSTLTAGSYAITVEDAHGCKSTVNFSITIPNAIRDTMVAADKVNIDCRGNVDGSATVGVKYGTAPYTYAWSDGQTTSNATGLSAGTYSVTVSDAHGCSGTTATVTITAPAATLVTTFGTVTCTSNLVKCTIMATGGTAPYTYAWSPGGGTKATMSGLAQGTYTVTVTDAHGCSVPLAKSLVCTGIIRKDGLDDGSAPSCCGGLDNITVYPNPNNGQFTIESSVVSDQLSVEIYNMLGQKVYSQSTILQPQFTINISDQPNGIYLIRMLDKDGNLVSQKKLVKTN